MATQPLPATGQLVTFSVAGDRYAIEATLVREVIRPPRLTRVPHAPAGLLGLGNLRGAVLPVVSLGALLGKSGTGTGRVIVLEQADPVGVMVDEVSAVMQGQEAAIGARGAHAIDLAGMVAASFGAAGTIPKRVHLGAVSAAARASVAVDEVGLLAFAVGGQEFALPLAQIEEVIALPDDITIIPEADQLVVGTISRRERLLPLLSLRHLLGMAATGQQERSRVVVARIGRGRVGFVVDSIRSLLRVPESDIDAVPAILTRGAGEAKIQAIARLEGGSRLVSVLAAEHLLRGDLTRHLQAAAGQEDDMTATIDGAIEQFLVFRIGEQDFGLPIGVVDEVTLYPDKLARLPRAPKFVQGVMNLRGAVIPVIDQGLRFQGSATAGKRRRVIVVSLGDIKAGFAVDAVAEVLSVPAASLRAAPELGTEGTRIFDRVANLAADGRMILIVEPQELLDRAERDMLGAMATDRA